MSCKSKNQISVRSSALALLIAAFALMVQSCATSQPKQDNTSPAQQAALMVQVANAALLENDPTGALDALFRAQQIQPEMPDIYHSMALAYYAKGDFSEALKNAQKAVKLAPKYPDANNTLGKILLDQGRYSEAIAPLYSAAHEPLYREAYKAYTNLGILYYRTGKLQKAEENFEAAINNGDDRACIAYYYRGHLELRESQYKEAIRDYKQATKRMCGGFADAHLAIGVAYERTKQWDLARKEFVGIQQRFPNSKAADKAVDQLRNLP